jgi:hypothetical protein
MNVNNYKVIIVDMFMINPYFTIFNENNWFFNEETKKINYSDEMITIDKIYLHLPFKNDENYNKKVINYFNKFINILASKISTPTNPVKVSFYANLKPSESQPIILMLKPLIYTDNWVKIPWEVYKG